MIRATDIHSLTDFTRNAKTYIEQIKRTKNPVAITVNGEAEVVVQDAATYQLMMDELERSRFVAAMRESEADVKTGRVAEAQEAYEDIRGSLGL